jgi:sulfatase maturation enzyme AslB (radical SAM superfamily)
MVQSDVGATVERQTVRSASEHECGMQSVPVTPTMRIQPCQKGSVSPASLFATTQTNVLTPSGDPSQAR